jgi:glycosyltransferase involved in cell wall biosynthesis
MCRTLQEQGTEITLVSTDHDVEITATSRSKPILFQGVRTIFFPSQFGGSFKYSRPLRNWLDENIADFDLVHIHAVFNHACMAAADACRKHRVPYIVRPLGTLSPWSMKQKSRRKDLFWNVFGKRMLQGAASVHYTSAIEQQATEASLGLNHGCVVPLGVEIEVDKPVKWPKSLTELNNNEYLLVLSRLHPKKGLDVLLDAFLSIAELPEFDNWRLVLAGDGAEDYVRLIREKVQTRGATRRVLFTGWLSGETKNAVLQSTALLVLPSYNENFGLCVMEAMAFGVPVLISPHVNLADDVQQVGAGWIAKVDSQSLQTALVEIMRAPAERKKRGAAGRVLARNFDWSFIAKKIQTVYEKVLTQQHAVRIQ